MAETQGKAGYKEEMKALEIFRTKCIEQELRVDGGKTL
jgi:hypothetical protein